MPQFNINLPGNIPAEVRQGKVISKLVGLGRRWPWIKLKATQRSGYIVTINDTTCTCKKKYHLIKTTLGTWPEGTNNELTLALKKEGRWQTIKEDNITIAIKKAIDEYENKQ